MKTKEPKAKESTRSNVQTICEQEYGSFRYIEKKGDSIRERSKLVRAWHGQHGYHQERRWRMRLSRWRLEGATPTTATTLARTHARVRTSNRNPGLPESLITPGLATLVTQHTWPRAGEVQ